ITAYWKGYKEYKEKGKIHKLPVMLGFQAEGAAPIVRGKIVEKPETIATAIRIGNPASWKQAEQARDESKGLIDMVSDDEILEAYKFLASKEGVFVEPASAASVAGVMKLAKHGYFKKFNNPKLVSILTGHGLKDPDRAIKSIKEPKVVPANLQAVLREISL
ncbi:MAG: pyridoxal-phosphate dependent enzyme, partial [Candidatus Omnitrophota bacterium]|nr:pyridoxal-phosphate dependent enzyme [Candidatus Omnitrophota bacterium]